MFNRKNKNSANLKNKNYEMKDYYKADTLFTGNLEYISSEITPYGPMVKTTKQKYLFEIINESGINRYREIFTGYVTDLNKSGYFDIPYIINIVPLKKELTSVSDTIHKYALLLILNEINTKKKTKTLKNN